MLKIIKHECNYCDGWEQEEEYLFERGDTTTDFQLQYPPLNIDIKVCIKCVKKLFDEVLKKDG